MKIIYVVTKRYNDYDEFPEPVIAFTTLSEADEYKYTAQLADKSPNVNESVYDYEIFKIELKG